MGRLSVVLGFALWLILSLAAIPASAEEVIEAWRGGGFSELFHVSVDPTDGSCWVADTRYSQVVKLAADGTELVRVGGFIEPLHVSVNPTDGSCWVSDYRDNQVVHLAADGTELVRAGGFDEPLSVSVNPTDGSCWVTDMDNDQVVRLAEDGTELWRGGGFENPRVVSVNPTDGSCWVADTGRWEGGAEGRYVGQAVVHLAADGTELWRSGGFGYNCWVSVNPTDGSCWVAALGNLGHLAEDGTELWQRGDFGRIWSVSVNPTDGSCWVPDQYDNEVIHLAEDGTELWRGGGFHGPVSVSVNPADGSCWVADTGNGQVVHLVICDGPPPTFEDVPPSFWAFEEIEACVASGIVSGYGDGLYHPEYAVTRDQMAVYISRALAGGDENVPDFTGTPTFPDVPGGFWALKYVEYAVSCSVVSGYLDGTYHPEYQVTRDQMAVYVARSICDPTGEDGLADYVPADPRNFPDVPSDFWSYKHVEHCVENGVVAGYLDGLYHPEIVVTRDQMAVYVARAFDLVR